MHGGIEGGSSGAKAVLLSQDGKLLATVEGPHTNHWLIGLKECSNRINNLIDEAKKEANIPLDTKLKSLGLSLSGADTEEVCKHIEEAVVSAYPNLADNVYVFNDTIGSMATATDKGGVIVIAGTGSICKLIRPDYSFVRVGGWGYMLGDEGSAYKVAYDAIKTMIDHEEGFKVTDYDMSFIKPTIFEHFQIKDRLELLTVFFRTFDKSLVSLLCAKFAKGARDLGDRLCLKLFYDTGYNLARQVAAVAYLGDKEMLEQTGGLHILCVGQVFKSWDLLQEGFLEGLKPVYERDIQIQEITLMHLETTAAFGAACVSAKFAGTPIKCDYSSNASVFYHARLNGQV